MLSLSPNFGAPCKEPADKKDMGALQGGRKPGGRDRHMRCCRCVGGSVNGCVQPAERGPGGGLTATYCMQRNMIEKRTPPTRNAHFYGEGGTYLCLLGAPWGEDEAKLGQVGIKLRSLELLGVFGGLLGAKMRPRWGQVGVKLRCGEVLEATWRQLGRRWPTR